MSLRALLKVTRTVTLPGHNADEACTAIEIADNLGIKPTSIEIGEKEVSVTGAVFIPGCDDADEAIDAMNEASARLGWKEIVDFKMLEAN